MKEVGITLVTSQPTDAAYSNRPQSDKNTPTFTILKYYITQYLYVWVCCFFLIKLVVLGGWGLGDIFFLTLQTIRVDQANI